MIEDKRLHELEGRAFDAEEYGCVCGYSPETCEQLCDKPENKNRCGCDRMEVAPGTLRELINEVRMLKRQANP